MIMKIIASVLLCLFVSLCSAQNFIPPRSSASITVQDSRLRPLLTFYLPHTHGLTLNGGLDTLGALLYEDSSGHVWYIDTVLSGGHKWSKILNNTDVATPGLNAVLSVDSVSATHGVYAARLNGGAPIWSVDSIYVRGDSRAVPAGLTGANLQNGWPLSLGRSLSKFISNGAIGGTIISDTVISGAPSFYQNLATLMPPARTKSHIIIWMFGRNDASFGCSSPLFASTQRKTIDTAVSATRNYLASDIYIIYGSNPGVSTTLSKAYHDSLVTICSQKGVNFIDLYSQEELYRQHTASLFVDGIHENNQGNNLIFQMLKNIYNSQYTVQDSAKSASVVGDIIDSRRIRIRNANQAYTYSNYFNQQNLSYLAADNNGNIMQLPNAFFFYSNLADSTGLAGDFNIQGNIKGSEGIFTGSYFGSGVLKSAPGLYVGQLNGDGQGYITADNGLNALPKTLRLQNNGGAVVINSISLTVPTGEILSIVGATDIQTKLMVGKLAHSTSVLTVGANAISEITDRTQGDMISISTDSVNDGISATSSTKAFISTNRLAGKRYYSGGTGIHYTVATGATFVKPTGGIGITIDDAYAAIDSGKHKFTDTVQLQYGSPATGKVLTSLDANGNAMWQTPSQFVETADNTVTNTTSLTSMVGAGTGSNTISANNMIVGSVLTVKGFGYLSTAAIAPSLTFTIANTTSSATITAPTLSTLLNNTPMEWEFTLVCRTTGNAGTGSLSMEGWVSINGSKVYLPSNAAFAFDTTIGQTIDLVAQFGTADPSNTIVTKIHNLTKR